MCYVLVVLFSTYSYHWIHSNTFDLIFTNNFWHCFICEIKDSDGKTNHRLKYKRFIVNLWTINLKWCTNDDTIQPETKSSACVLHLFEIADKALWKHSFGEILSRWYGWWRRRPFKQYEWPYELIRMKMRLFFPFFLSKQKTIEQTRICRRNGCSAVLHKFQLNIMAGILYFIYFKTESYFSIYKNKSATKAHFHLQQFI